jgi:short-subunit dehydrogenase
MAITDFKNRLVVVTGAASGIGRATALAFAREGANIVATDLKAEALDPVKREIEALGATCMTHAVDVADEAGMKAFADAVQVRFGAPHVVINNAGIGYIGLFLKSDLAHWHRMLDVNVMGVVHGSYFFLPMMLAAGGPRHLLNVASPSGEFPSPAMSAYAASKAAVSVFTEALKMELAGGNVHVATVFPGVVNTAIVRSNLGVSPSVSDATLEKLRNFYATKGCSPDLIAAAMLDAVRTDRDIVLAGPKAALGHYLKRISLRLIRAATLDFARKSGFLQEPTRAGGDARVGRQP